VSEGGRTGLTAVVVGVLFLVAMFFSPLAGVIPPEATAPVLVIVGYLMTTIVREINWSDPGIGIPALLTIVMMPFTFSITNGVAAGFITYTAVAILRGGGLRDIAFLLGNVGRWNELKAHEWKLHPLMLLVSGVFVWYFAYGVLA
jgi:AGZA family xanthine/uracil permease-like MFS transporter